MDRRRRPRVTFLPTSDNPLKLETIGTRTNCNRLQLSPTAQAAVVATRAFPVLLICDEKDEALPCRHTRQIYAVAIGPKQFWEVPGAFHTAGLGFQPAEFARRVLAFFANIAAGKRVQ